MHESSPETQQVQNPNYFIDKESFDSLQSELVNKLRTSDNGDTIYSVFIPQQNPYANLVRTLEAEIFPEIPEIMKDFEEQSVFLALVDTRPGTERIVHAFRLSSLALTGNQMPEGVEDGTGIALIDDILTSNQGVTADQFKQYYESRGIDLTKCISVETNFRVGEKVESDNGLPVSQLGYIAVFQAIESLGLHEGNAAIFAHLNKPAIVSLNSVGVEYESIMGREDLKTPTVGENPFDDHYKPVAIPANTKNLEIFSNLIPFAAPKVNL